MIRSALACAAILAAGLLQALEAPTLVTWQLDPYAQTTDNVIAAIERVTPAQGGGYVIDVGFSLKPSRAPTVQFVWSSSGGRTLSQVTADTACSFPVQSLTREGRWVYAYTVPAPTDGTAAVNPARVAVSRRCRFGGHDGRRLEGGGYAVITDSGIYVGRSGTFTVDGNSLTFDGGVLLVPTAEQTVPSPAMIMRAASVLPADTPTLIRGKRMSFPVTLPAQEATP